MTQWELSSKTLAVRWLDPRSYNFTILEGNEPDNKCPTCPDLTISNAFLGKIFVQVTYLFLFFHITRNDCCTIQEARFRSSLGWADGYYVNTANAIRANTALWRSTWTDGWYLGDILAWTPIIVCRKVVSTNYLLSICSPKWRFKTYLSNA